MVFKGKNIAVLCLALVMEMTLMAAPAAPGGGGSPGACFPNPCIPIDQGDYIILIIGLLFGLYFLFRKREDIAR